VITLNSPSSKTHQTLKTHQAFERTRQQLGALSDRKLLSNLENLDQRERRLKVLVLLYLSELEARRLYLPLGYSSLFEFCLSRLSYTRATAARRIRSARAAARYPEALAMLLSGEINITTLAMVSDILDGDNHEEILSTIKGKSTRQVELLVSRHRPVNIFRDTVRPVCVMRRVEESPTVRGTGTSAETSSNCPGSTPSAETRTANRELAGRDERSTHTGDSSPSAETNFANQNASVGEGRSTRTDDSSPRAETKPGGGLPGRVILEQRLKLGFTVSPEFMKKYNKIKSLLSSKYPEGINFEMLFDILMNEYLDKHDPDKRHARRINKAVSHDKTSEGDPEKGYLRRSRQAANHDNTVKRDPERRHAQKTERTRRRDKARKSNPRKENRDSHPDSRHIPPAVRDRVYARDKGRCSFIGADGTRCGSTWDLEMDHVIPFARGGDNSPGNLRLLCRKHNSYQAERAYGKEFMKNYFKK